ncbi:MAG: hypothetical protein HY980_01250 [Candidatus Magasanikbacteria bacterium]|nr:hypothetical protein [Candidatus Magasanikbacteria bacterium]
MSKLKEKFLADIICGDYLPNAVGVPISFLQDCLDNNDMQSFQPGDWAFSGFDELYGNSGEKSKILKTWVIKNLPQQFGEATETVPKNSEVDCLKIVKDIPELRQCIEYTDYLINEFQRKIDHIRGRLSSETNESLAKEALDLSNYFNEVRDTTGFDPEQDTEYLKLKEGAETPSEPANGRR